MAIRQFNVGQLKGLRGAKAIDLPNVVAIAGPNGAGKSALLQQLWTYRNSFQEPGTEVLFVGPHRTWRGGTVSDMMARSYPHKYEDILKLDAIPGFPYSAPGFMQLLQGVSRLGSNADDAQALVKMSIIRIENRAQQLITEQYRRQGNQIVQGTVPELTESLSEMVDTLLPHLVFKQIDTSEPSNVRVSFSPRTSPNEVEFDIDELSSGEKAAIALFMPFIERRVESMVQTSTGAPLAVTSIVPLTVIIDEPEIHLHPLLQLNVLEYMRSLANRNETQFIFTTHSPTLLDAFDPDELFLLSPSALCSDNPLSRLTTSTERLEVARSITGSTHLLTRGKPIVFVEGEPDTGPTASDQRILKQLVPDVQHWAVVPSHGRTQVQAAVADMQAVSLNLPGMPVFGLIDGDPGLVNNNDRVISWPVAMIENLLLDIDALLAMAKPYGAVVKLRSRGQVEVALKNIAQARRDAEVSLRMQRALPATTIRVGRRKEATLEEEVRAQTEDFLRELRLVDVEAIRKEAEAAVDGLIQGGDYLEQFHGKELLRELYKQLNFSTAGLSINSFKTELARHAAEGSRVTKLAKPAIALIQLYFPSELVTTLERVLNDEEGASLLAECRQHRSDWEAGLPRPEGRELLRGRLMSYGRTLIGRNEEQAGNTVLEVASAIGTVS